jgi:hypothetical protein
MSKVSSVLPAWRVLLNEIITKWHMLHPSEREVVTRLDYSSDADATGTSGLNPIADRLGIPRR